MWMIGVILLTISFVTVHAVYEKIGYFWHITDIHYDSHFSLEGDTKKACWRSDYEGGSRAARRPSGRFGDYGCDAPWELIESAAQYMYSRHNDNVEFVLWTGDALSHTARRSSEARQIQMMQNVTDLLRRTFSSQFVFPALGHDDPSSRRALGKMWSRWLPTDSMNTFESGGYYMIERKTLKLQIVVLNTNLMRRDDNDEDALRQWDWLYKVLHKCESHKETVYLMGHMPPGSDERHRGALPIAYTDYHNKRYLNLVRKYADIIVGQFFGHLHSDSFRIVYNEKGAPISFAMLAPSLTPRRTTDGPNNPGIRLYKFDKDTGQVLDYEQHYLDLSTANKIGEAEWTIEYTFSVYYRNAMTPLGLHNLAEKLTQLIPNDNPSFLRYYRANSVRMFDDRPSHSCDLGCAHNHYCAITRLDYKEHEDCLKTAASALASSSTLKIHILTLHLLIANLLLFYI